MKAKFLLLVAMAGNAAAADPARACDDDRSTPAQCRNGPDCSFTDWGCMAQAAAAELTMGFEPGMPGTLYAGDPCVHLGPRQCRDSSMCKETATPNLKDNCEFALPVGQRASKRGTESFTHNKIASLGLHNDLADMTCGEAFTARDCHTLNKDQSAARGRCTMSTWWASGAQKGYDEPVCGDARLVGKTPAAFVMVTDGSASCEQAGYKTITTRLECAEARQLIWENGWEPQQATGSYVDLESFDYDETANGLSEFNVREVEDCTGPHHATVMNGCTQLDSDGSKYGTSTRFFDEATRACAGGVTSCGEDVNDGSTPLMTACLCASGL